MSKVRNLTGAFLFCGMLALCAPAVSGQLAAAGAGVGVSFAPDGIAVASSEMGKLKISYPLLIAGNESARPAEIVPGKDRATMKYANGAGLTITLLKGRSLQFHFTAVPAGAKMQVEMDLPLSMREGSKWATDEDAAKPFPAEKGEQFVFRGNVRKLRLIGPKGGELAIGVEHGWQQMQDMRVWNTESFRWLLAADMPNGGECYYSVSIGDGAPEPEPARVIRKPAGPEKTVFKLANDGIAVEAGTFGKFTLTYPAPGPTQDKAYKLIEKSLAGNKAMLKYEGGGTVELTLGADGAVAMSFASMPADVKHFRMEMLIDFGFSEGGTWKVGDGEEKPFPKEKPAKPFLFQGNAERIIFRNHEGRTISLGVPKHSFAQLQDNREWGWKTFALWFASAYDRNVKDYAVKITVSAAEASAKVLVDKFGQSTLGDYPAKVKSIEELKADVRAEERWLASLNPPALDAFGGLPGSGQKLGLRKTGFFHVEKKQDRWFLVDPEGNAFFQLGVCVFSPGDDYTYIAGREHAYEWLPPTEGMFSTAFRPNDPSAFSFHLANRIRKTGKPYELEAYLSSMIFRVRKWGFNSGGAFSPTFRPAQKQASFPYVGSLPLSVWEGVPQIPGVVGAWDPFDEKNRQRVEQLFAERIAPHADDALLIGYFYSNEPIYENLPKVLPTLDGAFACKRRLVRFLQEKHKTVEAFNQAWNAKAASFDELTNRGLAASTPAAQQDVREVVGVFLDEYYRFVSETFRKHDKNHMLLGSRFQPGTIKDEQLCRICGKYTDVMSFNYYTYYIDKDLLGRIHAWSGNKPMLLSEFYFNSPKDSRLPGGGQDVASQEERGLAYRNYVEQGASLPFVVGIQWFTLIDQSVTGRFFEKYNGENANTGLISVADRPWRAMLEQMMRTNYGIYEVILGQRAPFSDDDARFRRPERPKE